MPLIGQEQFAEEIPDAPYIPPSYSGGFFGVGTIGWQDIGTFIDFSMGSGSNWWGDKNWPEPSLPTLDAETILKTTSTLPPAIDRRDVPPYEEVIPMPPVIPDWALCAGGDQAACDRMAGAHQIVGGVEVNAPNIFPEVTDPMGPLQVVPPPPPPPVFVETPLPQLPPPPPPPGEPNVSWIGDIYDIVDTGAGGILPGGVPFTGYPYPVAPPPAVTTAAPSVVSGPQVAAGPAPTCGGSWVYKKHCGQYRWVKQSRRKRKQLVSRSDLRGLAALKGVLGTGKAFEVWIATHS